MRFWCCPSADPLFSHCCESVWWKILWDIWILLFGVFVLVLAQQLWVIEDKWWVIYIYICKSIKEKRKRKKHQSTPHPPTPQKAVSIEISCVPGRIQRLNQLIVQQCCTNSRLGQFTSFCSQFRLDITVFVEWAWKTSSFLVVSRWWVRGLVHHVRVWGVCNNGISSVDLCVRV